MLSTLKTQLTWFSQALSEIDIILLCSVATQGTDVIQRFAHNNTTRKQQSPSMNLSFLAETFFPSTIMLQWPQESCLPAIGLESLKSLPQTL